MNNKVYFLLLCLVSNCSPVFAEQSSSLVSTIVTYPPEVTLEGDIIAAPEGFLQLDQDRINTLHTKYEKNFKLRSYLRYGSRAIQFGLVGVGLYNLGLFDFLIPNLSGTNHSIKDISLLKTQMELISNNQERMIKLLGETAGQSTEEIKKIITAAASNQSMFDRLSWIWGGVKSISQWVTISLCFAKAAQFHSYVEADPTFVWFFSNHSMSDRVDVLRRSVKAITDFNIPADYSLEYHNRAIEPALQSIAHNVEELIAFMDYYFESIDQELLFKQGMDLQSRYLFNVSNDFFKNIHAALQDHSQNQQAVAIIDDFRSDLITVIKRCQFFEKQFVDLD